MAKIEVPPGKAGWVQVVEGELEIGGERVGTSDAVGVEESIEIKAKKKTEVIMFIT